jgi:hypothetical protein
MDMCLGEGVKMAMLTITAWKKKLLWAGLALAVLCALGFLLLFGFGGRVRETQGPQPDDLQEDVLRQPMRVDAIPADREAEAGIR